MTRLEVSTLEDKITTASSLLSTLYSVTCKYAITVQRSDRASQKQEIVDDLGQAVVERHGRDLVRAGNQGLDLCRLSRS